MSGAGVGHLSIGEVLSLVQEDFPDVTISKIRFLESQGLIAPERTAAGYRKFYDSDIERLRWILRQQRDHFLPLKVIRKMLDQGVDVSPEEQPTLWSAAASGPAGGASGADPDAGAEDAGSDTLGEPADRRADEGDRTAMSPAHPAVASSRRAPTRPHVGAAASGGAGRGAVPIADPEDESAAESAGEPTGESVRREPGRPSGAQGGSSSPAAPIADTPAPAGTAESDAAAERGAPPQGSAAAPAGRRTAYSTPADVVAALQEDPRRSGARQSAPAAPSASAASKSTPEVAPVSEPLEPVRMNRTELCEATNLSAEFLAELEQFGLVVPSLLGGDPQYDADALAVARVAARYAELGVGARHLRMYKVAAEREAGLVEQLVVPLLKQRNPRARAEAAARADELQRMGAELHATLLRRGLGPTLGG